MGAVLAPLNLLLCGCGALTTACSCCSRLVPNSASGDSKDVDKNKLTVMSRFAYLFFMIIGLIAALVLRANNNFLGKIPFAQQYCDTTAFQDFCRGTFAVYRVSFALFIFFLMHFAVSIRCCGPPSFRFAVQTQGFLLKVLLLLGLFALTFAIPNAFFSAYGYFAAAGAALFLVIQVFVLIEFAHTWNDSWAEKAEESKGWLVALIGSAVSLTLAGVAMIVLAFVFYHNPDSLNFFTVAVIVIGVILFGVALKTPHGSLLTAAIVFSYAAYLNFSALSSHGRRCEAPEPVPVPGGNSTLPAYVPLVSPFLFPHTAPEAKPVSKATFFPDWFVPALSYVFAGVSLLWAAISAGASLSPEAAETTSSSALTGADDEEPDGSQFTMFHVVMMLASCYLAMLLSSWALGEAAASTGPLCADSGTGVMWVKEVVTWVTMALYIWTQVAPLMFPDRDFGRGPLSA